MMKVLIHMDALLDFRLAAVNEVAPEVIPKLMRSYDERLFDDFEYPNCSQSDIDEKLNKPGELLNSAMCTGIPLCIRARIDSVIKDKPHEKFEVDINTYPIETSEEEKQALVDIGKELFNCEVNVFYLPYHLYTGNLKKYDLLACYTLDWTSEIASWLTDNPQPNLVVYTARVLKVAAKERYRKESSDPFDTIELAFRPIFVLQFLPIKMYNALNDEKVEEIIRLVTTIDGSSFDPNLPNRDV